MKEALLIIDMLNDFVREGAPLQVPKTLDIIPYIKKELDRAAKNDIPVIYVCDAHSENDPEFKIWPVHCVKGTEGAKIIDELKPEESSVIVEKTTYDGFYNTNLEKILKEKDIEKVRLTGCVTNICILYTAASARTRGFTPVIVEKAVAPLNDDDHRWALKQMKEVLYAEII